MLCGTEAPASSVVHISARFFAGDRERGLWQLRRTIQDAGRSLAPSDFAQAFKMKVSVTFLRANTSMANSMRTAVHFPEFQLQGWAHDNRRIPSLAFRC